MRATFALALVGFMTVATPDGSRRYLVIPAGHIVDSGSHSKDAGTPSSIWRVPVNGGAEVLGSSEVDFTSMNSYHRSMKVVLSEKGQVTIPKALRDSLALTPGTALEFEEQDGLLVGRRVADADPLSRLIGLLPRMDGDAVLNELRGPAWTADLDEAPRDNRGR